jgi:2-alkyl-3-oxoalkanoate reductase
MKVFVAGATGVLGRELVPQLVARGHEVVGMTRSASKQDLVRSLGARPVVADALDPKMTNRLRTEATDHLLAAGRAVGARRFVAQSSGASGTPARAGRC